MTTIRSITLALVFLLVAVCVALEPSADAKLDDEFAAIPDYGDDSKTEDPDQLLNEAAEEEEDVEEASPEKLEYAKGSVCGYCEYCSFCEQCKDCPCETSAKKPNCKMCKYCKFCNLCSSVCDTICTPGGILDRFTGAIVNSLPTVDHDEVSQDIDSVRNYINEKREEL